MSYGMGWVLEDYRGVGLCSHAGAIDGFRVQITLVPKEKIGIVILANLHFTRMNLALSNSLVDLLLGLPREGLERPARRGGAQGRGGRGREGARAGEPPPPRHHAVA